MTYFAGKLPKEQLKTWDDLIEEVKKNTDLIRYPFDEFWFGVGFNLAKKEFNKKIKELERYYIRKKWIRPNTWELFYPDGTSSLMNFNPLEEQRKKFKKKIEGLKDALYPNNYDMTITWKEFIDELDKLLREELNTLKGVNNEGKE